jgi:hypothetical protein
MVNNSIGSEKAAVFCNIAKAFYIVNSFERFRNEDLPGDRPVARAVAAFRRDIRRVA